jgi:8-oxo-dGTP pyrophosphatase MutT (NUDIX family)
MNSPVTPSAGSPAKPPVGEPAKPSAGDPDMSSPPRHAASLVLLRDAPEGLQVLLLERPREDNVLSGAHVFPGGKLDADDSLDSSLQRFDAELGSLHARLGEPELDIIQSCALFMAAVREAFEESGLLLVRGADEALAARARAMRHEGRAFSEILHSLDLSLDALSMHPWSRWVTPKTSTMMRRRFDTRFFVACLPQGQQISTDAREVVSAKWLAPRDALERYWASEIEMAGPQIMTLAHLSRYADVDQVMRDAATRTPPIIRPEPIDTEHGRMICYPGDPAHPVAQRAMPGPTRMLVDGRRYGPLEGFDAFFS